MAMINKKIKGICDSNFQNVADKFLDNLSSDEEIGASYTVIQNGSILIDIYGGYKNKEQDDPWLSDTLVGVHSTGKGITSMLIAILIDKGLLDLNEYVSHYWPTFCGHGKEQIKIKTLLSHQAGMYAWQDEINEEDFYNWDYVVNLLEKQKPFHAPEELICYHP